MLIFSAPLIFLPILRACPQFVALFFGVNKTDLAPSRTWPWCDDQSCGRKLGSASRCSARYYCFSWFNDCTVKQMQLWCFIKIHLCTTGHYTSATSKDKRKTLYRNLCVCTARCCFSAVFFFFPWYYFFCYSEALLWLLWWWRNVTLVCDYLYEVCTRFPPTWVIAFFVFLPPLFFLLFLIKLTNNKRAGADRKSMRLGQPCGLRRRPDTDAFYALDDEAKWGPITRPPG